MKHSTERPLGIDPARVVADLYREAQQMGLAPRLTASAGRAGEAITAARLLLRAIGVVPVDQHGQPEREL